MEPFEDEGFEDEPIEPATPENVEIQDLDGASEVGTLASSGFTSLNTRVREHVFEGGRRYQSYIENRYPIPNDSREREREELKHDLLRSVFDEKIYHAPIGDHPQKILDLGTGSGMWAIAVAEMFQSASVIGVDLSPIQPSYAPPNVEWRIDDIEHDWPVLFHNADLVYMRNVVTILTDHEKVFRSVLSNLKPGGWFEVSDTLQGIWTDDNSIPEHYALAKFFKLLRGVGFAEKYKWNVDLPETLPDVLQTIGFTNVHHQRRRMPIGRWAKQSKHRLEGLMYNEILMEFVAALLVKHNDLGLTQQEAEQLQEEAKREMYDSSIHAYMGWISVWAQKPVSPGQWASG